MIGVQETPARLFYDFCLDEHVPSDHMLRGADRHLDLADLRRLLKAFSSSKSRSNAASLCAVGIVTFLSIVAT
jgi:transposase